MYLLKRIWKKFHRDFRIPFGTETNHCDIQQEMHLVCYSGRKRVPEKMIYITRLPFVHVVIFNVQAPFVLPRLSPAPLAKISFEVVPSFVFY